MLCITGNGLKTTDALQGVYEQEEALAPRLSVFENYLAHALEGEQRPQPVTV